MFGDAWTAEPHRDTHEGSHCLADAEPDDGATLMNMPAFSSPMVMICVCDLAPAVSHGHPDVRAHGFSHCCPDERKSCRTMPASLVQTSWHFLQLDLQNPTAPPTEAPTASPTAAPTEAPTATPTAFPTDLPTAAPTNVRALTGRSMRVTTLKGLTCAILPAEPDHFADRGAHGVPHGCPYGGAHVKPDGLPHGLPHVVADQLAHGLSDRGPYECTSL
jgi:hypothetical protein